METLGASRVFSLVLCTRWASEKRIEMSRIEVIAWWIGGLVLAVLLLDWVGGGGGGGKGGKRLVPLRLAGIVL